MGSRFSSVFNRLCDLWQILTLSVPWFPHLSNKSFESNREACIIQYVLCAVDWMSTIRLEAESCPQEVSFGSLSNKYRLTDYPSEFWQYSVTIKKPLAMW